jgi:hypothetical protein
VKLQTVLPAHRNQEIKIGAARACFQPGAKAAFADMEGNIGKRRDYAGVIEHRHDFVVGAEQALVQHASLARSTPENNFTHLGRSPACWSRQSRPSNIPTARYRGIGRQPYPWMQSSGVLNRYRRIGNLRPHPQWGAQLGEFPYS